MLGIHFDSVLKGSRIMVFADCENIVQRTELTDASHDVGWMTDGQFFSWTPVFNRILSQWGRLVRVWGYTSAHGDADKLEQTRRSMREAGITAPQVFQKARGKKRKQVDIALATEATKQAHLDNFDVAVFVTADGDFVPVFRCLKDMGKCVVLLSPPSGLSPDLARECDEHYSLAPLLTQDFNEIEILSNRSPLAGQVVEAHRVYGGYKCDVPLLIRRAKDAAPGRRSVALASRSDPGVTMVTLSSSSFSEILGRRTSADSDESDCGSQLLDLLPELEYSGMRLTISLGDDAEPGKAYRVRLSIHSESTTDHFAFSVVAGPLSGPQQGSADS